MRIKVEKIRNILLNLLFKIGVNQEQANIIVESYLEADLCGISTHGINTFPEHLKKFLNHTYPVSPEIKKIKEEVCFCVFDADGAIGPIAANEAMKLAVQKAKTTGIYTCFVRNANTLGPASIYNNIALKKKMIGITLSNSPAAMAPINGTEKLLGTNPIAISIPASKENAIIYDIATSQVAKSKIKQAVIENKLIPEGWATDKNGRPTTNPKEAIEGLVLPMAGYKGYGLSMCIDILSGVISGANFLDGVGKFYGTNKCMNVGFTLVAINPTKILDDTFFDKIDEYIKRIKNSKSIDTIKIPGENRLEKKKENIKLGIELNIETIECLSEYARQLEVEFFID